MFENYSEFDQLESAGPGSKTVVSFVGLQANETPGVLGKKKKKKIEIEPMFIFVYNSFECNVVQTAENAVPLAGAR